MDITSPASGWPTITAIPELLLEGRALLFQVLLLLLKLVLLLSDLLQLGIRRRYGWRGYDFPNLCRSANDRMYRGVIIWVVEVLVSACCPTGCSPSDMKHSRDGLWPLRLEAGASNKRSSAMEERCGVVKSSSLGKSVPAQLSVPSKDSMLETAPELSESFEVV